MVATGLAVAQTTSHPNVVVIVPDQLRASRLHLYGNPRPTSPNIDALAASGTVFQNFYANAPWTEPSHGALATSQFPSRHGATLLGDMATPVFPPGATLAEQFQGAGYQTAAFINNPVAGKYLLGRGFQTFDYHCGYCSDPTAQAPAVNQRIFNWLDSAGSQPFFIYVNYWEPHWPYTPPFEHDIFKSDAYPTKIISGYAPGTDSLFRWGKIGDLRAVERNIQLYDGFVHYIDSQIGLLIAEFKKRGLADNTIFLLTSDHGELLFSHPKDFRISDHFSLYDAVVHVPAVYWGKGIPAGKVVNAIASHVDTAPTLLDLAGLGPKPGAQGISLSPVITGDDRKINDYVYAETDLMVHLRSVRDDSYKLILDESTGQQQLFDIKNDPDEQVDIAAQFPSVLSRLNDALNAWRTANEPSSDQMFAGWQQQLANVTGNEILNVTGANFQLNGDGWAVLDNPANEQQPAYWTAPYDAVDIPIRTAVWRPNNPKIGRFKIYVRFAPPSGAPVASNVPVTVVTRQQSFPFTVDQTKNSNGWYQLGVFENPTSVMLSNQANGWVIADAVQFERIN